MRALLLFLSCTVLVSLSTPAIADWSDDFESYAIGPIHGLGGWHGWDGSAAATGNVTDFVSHSPGQSVEIAQGADLVQEYTGISSDLWIFSFHQYIPSSFRGTSYFILLNTYADSGPYNWSTQVAFADTSGMVTSEFELASLPLVFDRWVRISVEIDFGLNLQTIYYDGNVLTTKSWTEGLSGLGALNLAAIDLYANGATPIYYDDFDLAPDQPTATETSTWGGLKGLYR